MKLFLKIFIIFLSLVLPRYSLAQNVNLISHLPHENIAEPVSLNVNISHEINTILQGVLESANNLNSLLHNVNLSNLNHEVNLNLNGQNIEFNHNQTVTPAESIAISQVLSLGHQELVLNALGQAIGGSINAEVLGHGLNNLYLPQGVTLIDNAANVYIANNLVNYGNLEFSASTNVSANNILNAGTVTGLGNLNLTAQHSFINQGKVDVIDSLTLHNANITNAGLIEVGLGNINIISNNNLNIDNLSEAIFEARLGSINISVDSVNKVNPVINLSNGNYLSRDFNINAPNANVNGILGNVSGVINTNANSLKLATTATELIIGNNNEKADPTFVNTAGDIVLNGSINTNGANLAVISSGNIDITNSATVAINTTGTSSAGNVLMMAGLGSGNISVTAGSPNSATLPPGSPLTGSESVTINITSTSVFSGGNIDLTTNNTLASGSLIFNTQAALGSNGNGGNVTLVALASSTNYGGQVLLPANNGLNLSGNGGGGNGSLFILASNNVSGQIGISLGQVISEDSSGAAGNVSLYTTPIQNTTLIIDSTGTLDSGTILAALPTVTASNIDIYGSMLTPLNSLNIVSGGNITIANNLIISAGYLNLQALGSITLGLNSNLLASGINVGTINPGSFINVICQNFVDNGSITASANGANITIGNNSTTQSFTLSGSPQTIILNSSLSSTNQVVNYLTITSTNNLIVSNSLNLNATNANIKIISTNGNITLAANSTFNLNSTYTGSGLLGPSGLISANTITLGNGSVLATNNLSLLELSTTTLTDNGTITSSAPGGFIQIDDNGFANSGLTLNGTPNPITNTSSIGGVINVFDYNSTATNSYAINIDSNFTLNGGTYYNGSASNPSGGIAEISSASKSGNNNEYNTTYGTDNIAPGVTLTLTGGYYVELDAPNITIGSGATVQAVGAASVVIFETKNLINNGTLTSTIANIDMKIDDDDDLSLGDNDIIGNVVIGGTGTISFSGAASGNIQVLTGLTDSIIFNGSQTFSPGVNGTVLIQAPSTISFNANTTQTITNGITTTATPTLEISANVITFSANSIINNNSASTNSTVWLTDYPYDSNFTINGPGSGNTATINTLSNGSIQIQPVYTNSINFSGSGTLLLNTATTQAIVETIANGNILASTGFTLQSVNDLTLTASQGNINFSGMIDTPSLTITAINTIIAQTSADSLNVTATGSTNITDNYNGSISLSDANVVLNNNAFTLTMNNALNGSIFINGLLNGGNFTLTASGSGTITDASSSDILTGTKVSLISNGGNIGVNGLNFYINTGTVFVNTSNSNANVYLNDTDNVMVSIGGVYTNLGSNASFSLDMSNSGSIYLNGSMQVGTINLAVTGNGIITDLYSSNILQANNILLSSVSGNIGSVSNLLFVNTGNLVINSSTNLNNASIYIGDVYNGVVNLSNSNINLGVSSSFNLNTYNLINGSIVINGSLSGNIISLNISQAGTISQSNSTDSIAANNLTLMTNGASIGTNANPIYINTTNLSLSTGLTPSTANAYIVNSINGVVNLNNISVGNNLSYVMTNSTNGSINIDNNISGNSITLTASGSGDISETSSNNTITANSIYLNTSGVSVGSSSNPIYLSTSILNINTGSVNALASAYINDNFNGNVNIGGANIIIGNLGTLSFTMTNSLINNSITINSSFTLASLILTTNTGSIITNANVLAPLIDFTTGGGGNITVNANIGSLNASDTINASGSGYITTAQSGASIIGGSLSLVANNGEIGFGIGGNQPLITQANNIIFSANLSVGISNTSNSLNIGASGSNGNVYVYQTGDLTSSGVITAPVLGLYSFSGSNGIGSSSNIVQVNAHNVGFESLNSNANVYINDTYTGNVIMQQSQAGIVFKFTTAGPLSIYAQINQNGVVSPGLIESQIIAIQTLGGYGIYNEAAMQSNDFIFLTASQSGYIAQNPTNASMVAPDIALVTGGGAIGAGGSITIDSANVAASTSGSNGYVAINDSSPNSGIVGGQSGTYFTFNTNGNLNVYGSIGTGAGLGSNLGGSITLNANGIINLGVSSPINLTTNNGSVIIQNNNSTAGQINIANGDFILGSSTNANLGFVTMNIGSLSQINTVNPNPSNIAVQTSGGSNVYFGNNGIIANASGNVLFANGRNIVFNTGSLAASAISLGGKVQLTADPPPNSFSSVSVEELNKYINTVLNINNVSLASNTVLNINNVIITSDGMINTNVSFGANLLLNNAVNIGKSPDNQEAGQYVVNPKGEDKHNDNQQLTSNLNSVEPIAYNSSVLMNYTNALNVNSRLNNGSSLIIANNDMHFIINSGIILRLKRGAIVLTIVNNNIASFYNLHDNHGKSVLISAYNEVIVLNPGTHLSVSKSAYDFANINPLTKVGYRKLSSMTVKDLTLYRSDYSILSLVLSLPSVKALFTSSDKTAHNLASQILKTATIINSTNALNGAYQQIRPIRPIGVTAFNN